MSKRPPVARNTERMLWAEAIGHCMNPGCQAELIANDVNLGEMAHIKPHADGGDGSFENLILLCRKCHTQTGGNQTEATIGWLQEWEKNRNSEIEGQFAKRYPSFEDLKESVIPILERNRQIFDSYGPNDAPNSAERHKLWLKFEGELISNNRRLELILTTNKNLLHKENQEIVNQFVVHTREFIETRDNNQLQRVYLFPQELLSIFGIAQALIGLPPNLAALQNFLSYLIRENRFISLDLNEDPRLTYLDKGEKVTLMLKDRPRVQQIFRNGHFFKPNSTTNVRIENLEFFVQWLFKNNIQYRFADMRNLTELILNGEYKIKLCYEYVLSLSNVHMMELEEDDIVVNLHNWNGGPISKDAHDYASQIGVRLFSQNDFFKFAHKNIK